MWQAFVGSDAVERGKLTRGQLRWNYTAVHPDVYVANDTRRTLYVNTLAAWLWTGRTGIIAGRAAAALHGAKWVDDATPIEIIGEHGRRRPGVIIREERIGADEITQGSAVYPSPEKPGQQSTWVAIYPATSLWHSSTRWRRPPVSSGSMHCSWPSVIAERAV